jgi:hypothetical protein
VVVEHGVSDEALQASLAWYAGLVGRVLNDPSRWLGVEDARPRRVTDMPGRVLRRARPTVLGDVNPTSPQWASRPVAFRSRWLTSLDRGQRGLAAAAQRAGRRR